MDIFLGLENIFAKQLELPFATGDYLEIVAAGDRRVRVPAHQNGQRAEILFDKGFRLMTE